MSSKRKRYSPEFKAEVALAALRNEETPADPGLSIAGQCRLLGVNRSSFYYREKPVEPEDLELMRLIDEQYLKAPMRGTRSMRNHLQRLGYTINRKRVQRLMRRMGLEAIYPKPRTSRPHPEHRGYPYLLRGLLIAHPNQMWAVDITYIPMSRGFMYLVAVMDWRSRKVLSWRVSNTLDADFCVEALVETVERFGPPDIFNTDQDASSPAGPSRTCCGATAWPSAWTAGAAAWTTSSSSASGGRLNITTFTCMLLKAGPLSAAA